MAHATRASSMSLLHVEQQASTDILPRSLWIHLDDSGCIWYGVTIQFAVLESNIVKHCQTNAPCTFLVFIHIFRHLSAFLALSMDQMDAAFHNEQRCTGDLTTGQIISRTNLESLKMQAIV